MIPGIQPASVRRETISIDPQPLSNTAKGGKIMQINARPMPMTGKVNG